MAARTAIQLLQHLPVSDSPSQSGSGGLLFQFCQTGGFCVSHYHNHIWLLHECFYVSFILDFMSSKPSKPSKRFNFSLSHQSTEYFLKSLWDYQYVFWLFSLAGHPWLKSGGGLCGLLMAQSLRNGLGNPFKTERCHSFCFSSFPLDCGIMCCFFRSFSLLHYQTASF